MIEGRGNLGLILMKVMKMQYNDALELLDDIEAKAKKLGYKIVITKIED